MISDPKSTEGLQKGADDIRRMRHNYGVPMKEYEQSKIFCSYSFINIHLYGISGWHPFCQVYSLPILFPFDTSR